MSRYSRTQKLLFRQPCSAFVVLCSMQAGVCALSKHFAGFARCSASNTLPVLTLRVAISQNFMDSLHDECEQLFRVCLDHTHYDACAAGPHAKLNSVVDLVCEHVVRFCLRPTCRQACSIRAI